MFATFSNDSIAYAAKAIDVRRLSLRKRWGASTVETAIVLSVFLLVCFCILSLGLSTVRYNVLGAAARRAAREAIVRGAAAAPEYIPWGPTTYVGNAGDNTPIAGIVASILPTMSPAEVTIDVSWPDGDNEENDRVRVRLTYEDTPFLPFMTLHNSLMLKADCTMRIVH